MAMNLSSIMLNNEEKALQRLYMNPQLFDKIATKLRVLFSLSLFRSRIEIWTVYAHLANP